MPTSARQTNFLDKPDTEAVELDAEDNIQLELLGYKQEFKREFTLVGLVALCFSELSVLVGVSGTIWFSMGYLGLVGMTWGWLVGGVMGQALAHSLAELSSAYPTSGGLYYWSFMTAAPRYKKLSCYIVAWSMIVSSPLSLCSINYSASQLLMTTIQMAHPSYVEEVWHVYLVFVAMMVLSYLIICVPTRYLSWFNICAAILGVLVVLVTAIVLPVQAHEINSGATIFTDVLNQIQWPTGWAFCMTLISPAWSISGYDVAAHVAEEAHNAAVNVPRAIIWSTWANITLGFLYLVSLALCATDINSLLSNPLGQPIGVLTANILGPKAAVVLLTINIIAQLGCGVAFYVAASRIFWAYSRDKALPFSNWLSKINQRTHTPNNASLVVFIFAVAIGAIALISDTAFSAFISASVLTSQMSYILPVLGRCVYENNPDFRPGPYNLGKLSKLIRWTAVIWNSFIMVVVSFPTSPNPTAAGMNWGIVIYLPFQMIAMIYWYCWGHKTFTGPRPNIKPPTSPASDYSEKTSPSQ